MNKEQRIGVDMVRLFAYDKKNEYEELLKEAKIGEWGSKSERDGSFYRGMIEAFRLIDENALDKTEEHYRKKAIELNLEND